ncbi:MAG: PHP domain-containing protein [Nanoarchaeota archaeon]|nr:PHP domain-containing protein [Nanoarchaeota archaeon]MBU0962559.1 PHP domain-containing protein [Nanoarchaeota archaeon]
MKLASESVDINELKKKGLFFDMHFHTNYSDGSAKIDTISRICKKNNIGLSITDHNEIRGSVLASAEEINLIPGIEVRNSENLDMLFYFYKISDLIGFYNKYIKPNKRNPRYAGIKLNGHELIECSKKFNGISSLPHPFSFYHSIGRLVNKPYIEKGNDKFKLLKKFDAVEVMNGHLLKNENMKALELAEKNSKAFSAGSDGHVRFDLGKVLCYCDCKNTDTFLDNLKKKKIKVYYYSGRIPRMLVSRSWALRKHATHPLYYFTRVLGFGKRKILNNKV